MNSTDLDPKFRSPGGGRRCLGMMTKYWQPGLVKTRLAKSWVESPTRLAHWRIGDKRAITLTRERAFLLSADLHRRFVEQLTAELAGCGDARELVASPPAHWDQLRQAVGPDWSIVDQGDGDLGDRMARWFARHVVDDGTEDASPQAVLIGSDCPTLSRGEVDHAFECFNEFDVVLGPAADGGYYLIGISGRRDWRELASVFDGIAWSTSTVLVQTIAAVDHLGWRSVCLSTRHDVDTIDDMDHLLHETADPTKDAEFHNDLLVILSNPMPSILIPETSKQPVAVVGGGVIGLSIAWEAARRGHRVTLVDRRADVASTDDLPADELSNPAALRSTSWTAGGILPPANFDSTTDPMERLRGYSHAMWPAWAERLQQTSGVDIGFERCGGYYLAETAGEAASMVGMTAYWKDMSIECRPLSRDSLRQRQPWLRQWTDQCDWVRNHPERAAWWVPGEYQVRPPQLVQALTMACEVVGVQFRPGVDVHDLSRFQLNYPEHQIVLCGGVMTGLIDPTLRLKEALIPIRGQMLLLHCESFDRPLVCNVGNRYLIARGDGSVLVGSCEEEVGTDWSTTNREIDSIRSFAARLCPSLRTAPEIRRWSGLRPMTFDGIPMIGRVPGHERWLVASGHYRSGIHFAPATAEAIVDELQHQPTFMDMTPFSVGRQQSQPSSIEPS